jgi:hypothetical protein
LLADSIPPQDQDVRPSLRPEQTKVSSLASPLSVSFPFWSESEFTFATIWGRNFSVVSLRGGVIVGEPFFDWHADDDKLREKAKSSAVEK